MFYKSMCIYKLARNSKIKKLILVLYFILLLLTKMDYDDFEDSGYGGWF